MFWKRTPVRVVRARVLLLSLSFVSACNGPRYFGPAPIISESDLNTIQDDGSRTSPIPDTIYNNKAPLGKNANDLLNVAYASALKSPNDGKAQLVFMKAGFAVVDSGCEDFFRTAGQKQAYIQFDRDAIAAVGALATGALAPRQASCRC